MRGAATRGVIREAARALRAARAEARRGEVECRLHGTGSNDPDPARCSGCRSAQETLDAIEAAAALEGRFAAARPDVMAVLEAVAAGVDQAAAAAALVRRIRGF